MMAEKKDKRPKISKRRPGLVIEPPRPRPPSADDPSLAIFTEAKAAQQSEMSTVVPQYRSTAVPESPIPKERFYRKPNETADALDRNLTPAESKVLDHLLRLSVGFNRDTCQVRITTLLNRTGYRSDKTVRAAIGGLLVKGIIERLSHFNSPLGDEYRILKYSGTGVPEYRSTAVENTAVLESKITGELKTRVKDKNNDDEETSEALFDFNSILSDAARKLTGRAPKAADREQWAEVARMIVGELHEAAERAGTVSSVPAFLAAHLRRKLAQKPNTRKREGKQPASAAEATAPIATSNPNRRLSPGEITEQARIITELLGSGYTIEQADEQFAASAHPEDWTAIREQAVAVINS